MNINWKDRSLFATKAQEQKWDLRFLELAKHISGWSKDPSTQVGSVIVRPDRTIASLGYNGFPRGIRDSQILLHTRKNKLERIIHAEKNAIYNAHENVNGHCIYTWPFLPCSICALDIIQVGIIRVVAPKINDDHRWAESIKSGKNRFDEAGVRYKEYDINVERVL